MILDEVCPYDAPQIAAIYAHHVLHGTASFDTEASSAAVWRGKIADIKGSHWPFIVARRESE